MSQTRTANQNNLHIDNVVASQPELGPTPPDGGYGWIILLCCTIVQLTIPSLTIAYGIIILYANLQEEYQENQLFKLWEHDIVLVPILTVIVSSVTYSWCKSIIILTNRPRIVAIAGICLIGAGVLLSCIGVDAEEDAILFNIFSGLFTGIGTSLVSQQSEILLHHYFNNKYNIVHSIFKISVLFGNILISLVIGALLSNYGINMTLMIYTGIILQNCIVLLGFTRPTYVVSALQQNYKELKEASEDEDEEIFSSDQNPSVSNKKTNEEIHVVSVHDDEQDEHVISTFNMQNATKQVIVPSVAAISRMENYNYPVSSGTENYFERIEDMDPPESLYRETTISNNNNDNIFNFEPTVSNPNTTRRVAERKKSFIILMSSLKDLKFYVYTYVEFNMKLSILIFGLLFPAYLSQQLPDMEMWTITVLVVIVYICSTCLNIVIMVIPSNSNKRFFQAVFSLLSFIGFFGLSESHSKTLLVMCGTVASFSIIATYIIHQPQNYKIQNEPDSNIVPMMTHNISALLILLIMVVGNYNYGIYFRIVAILQMFSPIFIALINKFT